MDQYGGIMDSTLNYIPTGFTIAFNKLWFLEFEHHLDRLELLFFFFKQFLLRLQ
jgi:hypothetical protein